MRQIYSVFQHKPAKCTTPSHEAWTLIQGKALTLGEGHSFAMQQYIHATGVANITDYFSGQKVILRARRTIWLHMKTTGSGLTELAFLLVKMC